MTGVLQDCYVVDVTEGAQGPFAASLLADLGATVVKVERPGGELMRHGSAPTRNGAPMPILSISRGRVASVTVDLKSEAGRQQVLELLRDADIFIENWRPGTAARLGLSKEELWEVNPRLVYLSASGFGSAGPFAHLGSMDSIAAASGGLSSVSGEAGGRSERYRLALLDFVSAMVTAEMSLAALLERELSGKGTQAETSQLEAAVAVVSPLIDSPDGGVPAGSSDRWAVPSLIVQATDGVYVALHADTDARWRALADALGLERTDRWAHADERWADRGRVEQVVAEAAGRYPSHELLARIGNAEVPAAVVHRSIGSAMNTPEISDTHIAFRRAPQVGWIAMAQVPWRFADVHVHAGQPCPALNTAVVDEWHEGWGKHARR